MGGIADENYLWSGRREDEGCDELGEVGSGFGGVRDRGDVGAEEGDGRVFFERGSHFLKRAEDRSGWGGCVYGLMLMMIV